MSLTVKAYLLGKDEAVKEVRRFAVDHDVSSSFEYLCRKTADIFNNLKNSGFTMFYKGEKLKIPTSEASLWCVYLWQLRRVSKTKSSYFWGYKYNFEHDGDYDISDEDGDLVAFSSDDELMMGLACMKDSTFRIFIKGTRKTTQVAYFYTGGDKEWAGQKDKRLARH